MSKRQTNTVSFTLLIGTSSAPMLPVGRVPRQRSRRLPARRHEVGEDVLSEFRTLYPRHAAGGYQAIGVGECAGNRETPGRLGKGTWGKALRFASLAYHQGPAKHPTAQRVSKLRRFHQRS